jgi:hypothetical protein
MNDSTKFEAKYGRKDTDKFEYHISRRMFAIKGGELYIADENADYSHAEWFKRLNWITEKNDTAMGSITRGALQPEGLFFYTGYDFTVTASAEQEMLSLLSEVVQRLHIAGQTKLFGGKIFDSSGKMLRARKDYGQISKLLAHSE